MNAAYRPGRRRRLGPECARWLVVPLAFALAAAPSSALAWGFIGHRISARLAEARLKPAALAEIRALLGSDAKLEDISTWADQVRRDRPESGPWHYVNVPINQDHVERKYCPDEGCVLSAIDDQRAILKNRSASDEERRDALKFLVHFVQDLHQPVHVGDNGDRGGNDLQVQFFGKGSNLHRVWDSGLIEQHSTDAGQWEAEIAALITPETAQSWARGSVDDWADESLARAKAAYRVPGTKDGLKPGAKLEQAYLDEHLPVVRERLAMSSVRLARVLNETLAPEPQLRGMPPAPSKRLPSVTAPAVPSTR